MTTLRQWLTLKVDKADRLRKLLHLVILALMSVFASGCGTTHVSTVQKKTLVENQLSYLYPPPPPYSIANARTSQAYSTVAAGSQTTALPGINGLGFQSRMTALWTGLVEDNPAVAMQAFFPLTAYLELKNLTDNGFDYANRLVAHYVLDIEAAHNLIASQGGTASFEGVRVPLQYARWINPGVCYNKLGYWHVPGARLMYRIGNSTYSIGIASLISWQGKWYVVHLGAINRTLDKGYVDSPATGIGFLGPPGGC
jgi:hypothetical protein